MSPAGGCGTQRGRSTAGSVFRLAAAHGLVDRRTTTCGEWCKRRSACCCGYELGSCDGSCGDGGDGGNDSCCSDGGLENGAADAETWSPSATEMTRKAMNTVMHTLTTRTPVASCRTPVASCRTLLPHTSPNVCLHKGHLCLRPCSAVIVTWMPCYAQLCGDRLADG